MGGHAFDNDEPRLLTPRMPSAVYVHIRDVLLEKLRTFYAQVECPIEEPAKADYGDVDILVAGPLQDVQPDLIAAAIGAVRYKTQGGPTTHFAIPWPKLQPLSQKDDDGCSIADNASKAGRPSDDDNDDDDNGDDDDDEPRYIQLDLQLCNPESFAWEVFHQAHGDFWSIVGFMIWWLGLTVTNSGLYVRVKEIEGRNKKAARVLLTRSPAEALRFLGLDEKMYWQRFETVDGLFAYAATCRFFEPKRFHPTRTRTDMKANDRARARKRAVFRKWFDEYLPAHVVDYPPDAVGVTLSREKVVDEAKTWFGVVAEYDARRLNSLRG